MVRHSIPLAVYSEEIRNELAPAAPSRGGKGGKVLTVAWGIAVQHLLLTKIESTAVLQEDAALQLS